MKWRLAKHELAHNSLSLKYCHNFNNGKHCPYEEVGCTFKHEPSKKCWFQTHCSNKFCQFQHNREEITDEIPTSEMSESLSNVDEELECGKCKFVAKTETNLLEHLDNIHEE